MSVCVSSSTPVKILCAIFVECIAYKIRNNL